MIRKEKIRVYAAWLAAIFLFVSSRGSNFSWWGVTLVVTGLAIRIWATGYLQKNQVVTSSGPYAYTRNPLYVGSFLMGIGFFLAIQKYLAVLILTPMFIYLYYPVILDEERILEEKFGSEFKEYMSKVPRIIPSFDTKISSQNSLKFSWENVIRNKEYNAVVGFLLALGIIFIIRNI